MRLICIYFFCLISFNSFSQEYQLNTYLKVYTQYDNLKERFQEVDSIKLKYSKFHFSYDEDYIDVELGEDIDFTLELDNQEIDHNQLYPAEFVFTKNKKYDDLIICKATICCVTREEIRRLKDWEQEKSSDEFKIAFTFYDTGIQPFTKIILMFTKTKILN